VGTSRSGEDVRVLRPGDIRRIPERHALVVAGNAPPIIARLQRCFDGKDGDRLKAELDAARAQVNRARIDTVDVGERTAAALAYARDHRLVPSCQEDRTDPPYGSQPGEGPW
jgi:uracil-DNA glycosylase